MVVYSYYLQELFIFEQHINICITVFYILYKEINHPKNNVVMAEIKQGILSEVIGKVGTIVGVRWRGRNIIRAKPHKSRKKATEAQLRQWDKMSLVSTFTAKFKDFVNMYCPTIFIEGKWMTGKEQMISRLMKKGIELYNGVQYINIEQILLSIGTLAPAVIKKINRLKTGKIKVQWDNALINALTLDNDTLTMMAYNEELDAFIDIPNIGTRADRYAHFCLPAHWDKGRIYLWSMWKSADNSINSTSCFHGVLELAEQKDTTVENNQPIAQQPRSVHTDTPSTKEDKPITSSSTVQEKSISQAKQEIEPAMPIHPKNDVIPPMEEYPLDKQVELDNSQVCPPGYIRKVSKELIRRISEPDKSLIPDTMNEAYSILKLLLPDDEQRE